jgi:hypothetical protein
MRIKIAEAKLWETVSTKITLKSYNLNAKTYFEVEKARKMSILAIKIISLLKINKTTPI